MEQEELSPLSSRHATALEQADAVLEIVGGNSRLDGFNLLGVVANPRAGGLGSPTTAYSSASSAPSSTHGRYNPTNESPGTSTQNQTTSYNILGSLGYFQSFEQTITQVSESIGVFNNALEDWSRSILEDHPTALSGGSTGSTAGVMSPLYAIMGGSTQDDIDTIPESQLKDLPEVLENPTTSAIQAYIQQSGPEADSFQKILAEENNKPKIGGPRQRLASSDSLPTPSVTQDSTIDLDDIPAIFFDENFDLTDPTTFCELLLLDKGLGIPSSQITNSSNTNDDKKPVTDIIRVPHPDTYNGFFDKVELALLEQVRANSNQFFVESQRFARIHTDIHQLLDTVQEQKSIVSTLKRDVVQTAEVIPTCDDQRGQLRQLWEVIDCLDSLFICKEGLAGIISAKDDLLAIEQIQHGRKLLQPFEQETLATSITENNTSFPSSNQEIQLGRIRALKSISEQFDRYEELVVNNLLDELVEIFLTWNDHSISSQTSTSSSTYVSSSLNLAASSFVTTNLKDNVRKRVKEVIVALQSCHAITKAEESYQVRLQDMIRMIVRTTVSEFASDGGTSITSTISSAAAAMSFQRFLDCLDMLFDQLVSLLTSTVRVDAFLLAEGLSFVDNAKDAAIADSTDPSHTAGSTNENGTRVDFDSSPKTKTPLTSVLISAVELSSKSISELLRIRKEAHSLVSLEEMKALWDKCTDFTRQLENLYGKGYTAAASSNGTDETANSNSIHVSSLKSTLLSQAKAFVERKHESHMSSLVAALDSERWVQSDVSSERQSSLDRLCTGRTILIQSSSNTKFMLNVDKEAGTIAQEKLPEIEAEGVRYKVVWSCLLLLEMILTNIAISAQFSSISTSSISKVAELLRLFNSRTTHLVLGAGAIHSNARLKSINAKHLSLVTQCLGLIMAILPHVRAALATQMPKKQHTLLTVLDQIKKEYADHNEKILNKFVSIIGGIVEHGLMKQIYGTDFDKRAKAAQTTIETPSTTIVVCCGFLDGVATNTRKMHQVLSSLLPPDHLKDVFSRIFAYIDGKVPSLFITAAETSENQKSTKLARNDGKNAQQNQQPQPTFSFPKTVEGKRQLLLEVESTTTNLNNLEGIHPWDFTARNVLERRLEYSLTPNSAVSTDEQTSVEKTEGHSNGAETNIQPDEVTTAVSCDPNDDGEQSTTSRSISRINSQDDDNEPTVDPNATASGDTDSPTPESDKVHSNELVNHNVVATTSNDPKEEDKTTNDQSAEGNVVPDSSQSEPNELAELSPDAPEENHVSETVTPPEASSNPSVVESE